MSTPTTRIALVTGGNKGIGLAICRGLGAAGFSVLVGARDADKGNEAALLLRTSGVDARAIKLDVTNAASIHKVRDTIREEYGRLDVLVNNAGINIGARDSLFSLSPGTMEQTLQTNLYGPLMMMQAVVPLMKDKGYGRIVNVSSTLGSLSEMADPASPYGAQGMPSYRVSKAALNVITIIAARELKGTGILVNTMCPGWVKTDMGGANAPLTVDQGADTAIYLATLPDDGPTGQFFFERKPRGW